jgi:hypothetical protein
MDDPDYNNIKLAVQQVYLSKVNLKVFLPCFLTIRPVKKV